MLLRIGLNVALELIIGAVPVAGDLLDFAFRANERKVGPLDAGLGPPEQVPALLLALALVIGLVALVVEGPFG